VTLVFLHLLLFLMAVRNSDNYRSYEGQIYEEEESERGEGGGEDEEVV
jgi:hypothetical protein